MKTIFLVFQIVLASISKEVLVIFGSKTPELLKLSYLRFPFLDLSISMNDSLANLAPLLILDLSYDLNNFPLIDSISERLAAPYLTLTKSFSPQFSSNRLQAVPSLPEEANALSKLIMYFNWKSFTIFLSNSLENIIISDTIKEQLNNIQIKTFIYDSEIAEESLDILVKRYLKVTSVKNLLVLDEGKSLELLIKLLKKRKINSFGNYFLFGSSSIYSVDLEGSVILSYEDIDNVSSFENLQLQIVENLIGQVESFDLKTLKRKCLDSKCSPKFSILNQINHKNKLIGTIGDSVLVESSMTFPGNNSKMSAISLKTQLPVLIANGAKEPDNSTDKYFTSTYFNGALLAVKETNSELENLNFEFKTHTTDCGNYVNDLNWSIDCFKQYSHINSIAYLTGYWAQAALLNLLSLRSLGLKIPQVSPNGLSETLNNKAEYPELLKLSGDIAMTIKNLYFVYSVYGWKELLFLVDTNEINIMTFKISRSIMEKMGLKIITPEKFLYMPENYTRENFHKYKHVFRFIRNSGNRILTAIVNNPDPIFEGLYDIGLRKGEILIISSTIGFYSLVSDDDEKYLKKRREILDGALLGSLLEYQGEIGKKVEKEMKKKFKTVFHMCLTYDAFLVISNSVKYLIDKGENYEDSEALIKVMRFQRFLGCTGEVFFISSQNSRNNDWFSFIQVVVNSTSNEIELLPVVALNKLAVIAAKQLNKPIWATGEDSVPSNYRTTNLCVYNQTKQPSTSGMFILHSVSIILMLIVLLFSYLSFRRFNYKLQPMPSRIQMTFNDMFQQVFFIFEFLQIISLEPDQGLLGKATNDFHLKLGFDIIRIFNLRFNDFWKFFRILLITTGISSVLTVFNFLIKNKLSQNSFIFERFKFISESVLPIFNHLLFMPVVLMLLSIYKCEEGISNELFESFFYRDCSQFCYQGTHLLFVSVSSSIIIIHLAVITYFRPFWEKSQLDLNIKTKVNYFSILSCFQCLLVIIKVNLETYNKFIEGCFLCAVLFVQLVITIKLKPFNYEKCNIIQSTLLVMSLLLMILDTIYYKFPYQNQLSISLLCCFSIALLVALRLSNRCPKRFLSDYNDAVPTLIKFQFSSRLNRSITQSKYFRKISYRIEAEPASPKIFHRVPLK